MADIAPPINPQMLTPLQRADLPWFCRARLEEITDGDTFIFLCDTMFRGRHEPDIRLVGYSAPERNEAGGTEATQRLKDWLLDHEHGAEWPYLMFTQRDRRTFARWLGSVWCVADGNSMQATLEAGR